MNIIKKISCIFITLLITATTTFGLGIDHLEVVLNPENAKSGEAIDLEIRAVDKNKNTITDYDGTIYIMSETDYDVELPGTLEENTYVFTPSDQWVIKFENAVKFKAAWEQEINVYDLNDDTVIWKWIANIEKTQEIINYDISILSPESGITLWEKNIKLSGSTQKNHTIKIILNNTEEFLTSSDNNWMFEKEIDNLDDGVNNLKAQILDADNNIIWESDWVQVNVSSDLPKIISLKLQPKTVNTEESYNVEVITSAWVSSVEVIIDDSIITLKQDQKKSTQWTKQVYAPKNVWNYKIDAIVKDSIWHEIKELWIESLEVKAVPLQSANQETKEEKEPVTKESTKTHEEKKSHTWSLEITGLKVIELKSKSVLTWDPLEEAVSYNIFKKKDDDTLELITNVTEAKFEIEFSWDKVKYDYFAIQALWKHENKTWTGTEIGELYEWSLSDATKVKTGPEFLLLIIISLFLWWMIFILKRRNS